MLELLVKRVWCKARAGIQSIRSAGAPQGTSTTTRLPQEIVEMIIFYLVYDRPSLCACSLTCRSWYITAAPHLHHTYLLTGGPAPIGRRRLKDASKLGLLPLVKTLRIYQLVPRLGISSKLLNRCTLHHFSRLRNVQELGIDFLDVHSFMSSIQHHFGHFLPTVRSLALRGPRGSCRQIVFFIGMFQHLEDLKLLYDEKPGWELMDEPTVSLPPFTPPAPPLQGRLTMTCFTRVGILEVMIETFGGIRFRQMDLFDVDGMRLLLDASASTLETLRLYPEDPRGQEASLKVAIPTD